MGTSSIRGRSLTQFIYFAKARENKEQTNLIVMHQRVDLSTNSPRTKSVSVAAVDASNFQMSIVHHKLAEKT
jgi:triosephosphate isomerase